MAVVSPEDVAPLIFVTVGGLAGAFVAACVILCCDCDPEAEQRRDGDAAAAGPRSRPTPAPVRVREPQQLVYFSYPAVVVDAEGGKRTAGASVVVCTICLEALVDGAECSEVPACRHVFHRSCLALWTKGNSTCPLCRRPVVPGSSEPLSTAEAMV